MTKAEKMQMQKIMQNLECDEETAKEILESDKRIDKGEKLFELSADQKKAEKQARNFGNCNLYTKPQKKEKPIDTDKRKIIELIAEMTENVADAGVVEVINPEREIIFTLNGRKFKIVLSCPRT